MTSTASAVTPSSAASATSGSNAAAPANALAQLTNNFNSFLNLLLTQLQTQDPSSPMDTNQFTSELVQMSNVEQQITTNTNLTQLIQATQGTEIVQGSSLVGQTVSVTSSQVPLQNGAAALTFTAPGAGNVSIKVTDATGADVADATVHAKAGANGWTWNGLSNAGTRVPDGAYGVTVTGAAGAVPFTVSGTVTGVGTANGAVQLQLGGVSAPFTSLAGVGG